MGHLTSAVHWWEDSQMRVLVLSSLVAQFLLYIFTYLRIRAIITGWSRFLTWLAYLGGDAIAIYGLATLFTRHKQEDQGGGGGTLEVVWAPILLLHLGGNDGITAYNIEDNELWTRHLLTAVTQVTVAIYVFCKSWPWPGGDKRLLLAAIVLFVPGILKCFAKPWDLKRASIKSLVSLPAAHSVQRTEKQKQGMKHLDVQVQPATTTSKLKQVLSVREQKGTGADDEQTQGGARVSVEDGDNNPVTPPPRGSGVGNIPPIQGCCRRRSRQRKRDALPQGRQNEAGDMETLEQYVKGAMTFVREQKGGQQKDGDELSSTSRHPAVGDTDSYHLPSKQADDNDINRNSQNHGQLRREKVGLESLDQLIFDGEAHNLFVDLPSPYPLRLVNFECFWVLSQEMADKVLRHGLASAFMYLYTKLNKPDLRGLALFCWRQLYYRGWIQILRLWLPPPAIVLFHYSHREAYRGVDVKITYALFFCTAVLELCSIVFSILVSRDVEKEWPGTVAQYNLIGYFARDKNNSNKVWIASKSGCKDFLDQHWSMESCLSSGTIVELVLEYLKAGWKEKIHDPVSYHKFNDNRGQWALEKYSRSATTSSTMKQKSVEQYEDKLGWSIKGAFDKSVLLWHIATDFCFFSRPLPTPMSSSGEKDVQCRRMSSYMMYLLFVNPEMLLPGTRRHLFTTAYNDLKYILRDKLLMNPQGSSQQVEENTLMETLIETMTDKSKEEDPNFIDDAWELAQGLLKLRDDFNEEKMWEVIQGVWVEMLCFSASRCRGYLHAKALGSGGEFLSYVWLTLFYMGMETFTERLQREELPSQEANNNGAPPPCEAHNGDTTTPSSTSWIRSRSASSSTSHLHTGASTSSSEIEMV